MAEISKLIDDAQKIVIIQAENPDGDSLGSALALEAILGELGKSVYLYCAVDMQDYLKYLTGWSRVSNELPSSFDMSIIVDASSKNLFEKSAESGQFQGLATKPCIVLDHHGQTANDIDFATSVVNRPDLSSTCELVYRLAKDNNWAIPKDAHWPLMTGILGDTQGLSNQLASADTYSVMAELVSAGADRPAMEEARREYSKMAESIYKFKAVLIERTAFEVNGQLAMVTVSHDEVMTYSPLYNPGPLIQSDMLQVEGVKVGIVFKVYPDKITAMVRCNNGAEIGDKLAAHFGGGGHPYAAGFKITNKPDINALKEEVITKTEELLAEVKGA